MDREVNSIEVIRIVLQCLQNTVELGIRDRLTDIPGWSSIIYVMVIAEIEGRFQIELSSDDLFDVETIGDLVDLIGKNMSHVCKY